MNIKRASIRIFYFLQRKSSHLTKKNLKACQHIFLISDSLLHRELFKLLNNDSDCSGTAQKLCYKVNKSMLLLLEDWKSPYLKGAVGYNFGEDAI